MSVPRKSHPWKGHVNLTPDIKYRARWKDGEDEYAMPLRTTRNAAMEDLPYPLHGIQEWRIEEVEV